MNLVWYRNCLVGADLDDLLTDTSGLRRDVSVPPGAVAAHHIAEAHASAAAHLPPPIAEVMARIEHPFIQVVFDLAVDRMAFARTCLVGDSAFVVRPHAAAGTAKAADDAWTLRNALIAHPNVGDALRAWEPRQLQLGRSLLDRTRRIGQRSQFDNDWAPGDPELIFGLHAPGN